MVESGGKEDFQYGGSPDNQYTPAKVDRVLHDGDQVRLGGAVMVAHRTPGHTKGTTTWTMKVEDGGKAYEVVIVGAQCESGLQADWKRQVSPNCSGL